MKNPKIGKSILVLVCGLFIAASAFFSVLLGKTYREYTNMQSRAAYYEEKVADKEAQLKEKADRLRRLRHDPEYVDRVIRQRLGYAKPGELVFRFEEVEVEELDEEPLPQ